MHKETENYEEKKGNCVTVTQYQYGSSQCSKQLFSKNRVQIGASVRLEFCSQADRQTDRHTHTHTETICNKDIIPPRFHRGVIRQRLNGSQYFHNYTAMHSYVCVRVCVWWPVCVWWCVCVCVCVCDYTYTLKYLFTWIFTSCVPIPEVTFL